MYKIIGTDGREYGPVTVEQVHQWIREGRANAQTKVQPEGGGEWKALGELAEFSAAFASGAAPSLSIPVSTPGEGGPASHEIDIASCISRGWNLVKNNFGPLVGTSFLVLLLVGGVGGLLRVLVNAMVGVPMHMRTVDGPWSAIGMRLPGIIASSLWNLFAGGALLGGLYNYYLKFIRGQPAELGDAFAGFRGGSFMPLTAANFVVGILTVLGFLCCVLPGIYLGTAWKFTLPLIIDKKLGFGEAMDLSRKTVTRQWWSVFALLIVAGLLSASGIILCCIGAIITAPIGIATVLYAYEDIFGDQPPAQNI